MVITCDCNFFFKLFFLPTINFIVYGVYVFWSKLILIKS